MPVLQIRLKPEELAMITEAAQGQQASKWARGILLDRAKREIEGVVTAYAQPPPYIPIKTEIAKPVPRAQTSTTVLIRGTGGMVARMSHESAPGLSAVLSKLPSAPVVDLTKPQTKPRK